MISPAFKRRLVGYVLLPAVLLLSVYGQAQQKAQQTSDTFLNRLNGAWEGEGQAFGRPARLQLKWEWVLGNKFLRLSLRNEMQGANGESQVFEGHAYYQPSKTGGTYEARWFDTRGVTFPIRGHTEGDALIALWGSPETEQGKSIYRLVEPGKLEVVDSVQQKDGAWREFGKFVLKRR